MTSSVRLLSGADAPQLRRLLHTDPVAYSMVAERTGMMGVGTPLGSEVWGWFDGDELRSALYLGANVVPIEATEEAVAAFAARAVMSVRRCSSIVGPAEPVLGFGGLVEQAWGPAREVRPKQPLLSISGHPHIDEDPRVRVTELEEVDVIFPACVAMFTEELGITPIGADGGAGYRRRVAGLVRAGRSFVIIEEGEVLFKAEVGVVAEDVAQIQGVWVDPRHRGRGVSEPAMASVVSLTRQLHAPTVSLYVNDYNRAALASYQRVGFTQVGEFATVLY